MLGMLMLSSAGVSNVRASENWGRTVRLVRVHVNVKLLVPLEGLPQKLDLGPTLVTPRLSVGLALLVSLHLVELHHLVDALEVLLFYVELELDLREHELDARPEIGRVEFDKVCGRQHCPGPSSLATYRAWKS